MAFQPPHRPLTITHTGQSSQRSGGEDQAALDTERRRSRHLCEELRVLRAQMLVTERRHSSSTSCLPSADEVHQDSVRVRKDNLEVLLQKMGGLRCGLASPAASTAAVRVARRAFAEAELALLSLDAR